MKYIKENLQILVIMTIINFIVLWNFISNGQTKHGIGYFIFFYVAILTIHFFTKRIPPKKDIEIKEPKKELIVAIIFALLGGLFITLNFALKYNFTSATFFIKLPVITGVFIFTFPLGILTYLLFKKYNLLQLGLYTRPLIYILLGVVIWGITGLFAFAFNESGILWTAGLKELNGVFGLILQGIIGAALVEEFSRFIIQSRLEKVFKTVGFSILLATIIWAFLHFPVNHFKGTALSNNLSYCIRIIPIGFIWGYLIQRTKSILPSVFAHGLNLWGFQNG